MEGTRRCDNFDERQKFDDRPADDHVPGPARAVDIIGPCARRWPASGRVGGRCGAGRIRPACVRGRDLDQDPDGAAAALGAEGPSPEGLRTAWPLALPRS